MNWVFLCRILHPQLPSVTAAIWASDDTESNTWRRDTAFVMMQLAAGRLQLVTDAMLQALAQLPPAAWIDAQPWPRRIAPRLILAMRSAFDWVSNHLECSAPSDRMEGSAPVRPLVLAVLTIYLNAVHNCHLRRLFVHSSARFFPFWQMILLSAKDHSTPPSRNPSWHR